MNKNTKQNNAPATNNKAVSNKGATNSPAEKGTKENPWNSETLPQDWETNPAKYASHFFQKGDKSLFQFDKEGKSNQRGNWRGTAHSGRGENKGGAGRLKKFFTGNIIPVRLTDETEENFKARAMQVNLGTQAIKAIAGQIKVKTAAREAGEVVRPKTEAEIDAETLTFDRKALLAFMSNPANLTTREKVEASEGKTVLLSELTGTEALEPGQEANAVDAIMQAVRAAIRAA